MKDASQLTLGEVAKVEEVAGVALSELGDDAKPKGMALAALVWVFKRREDRSFTLDDALDMTLADAEAYLGLNEVDNEVSDEGEGSGELATSSSPNSASPPASNRASTGG